jgi:hypothetical protein
MVTESSRGRYVAGDIESSILQGIHRALISYNLTEGFPQDVPESCPLVVCVSPFSS